MACGSVHQIAGAAAGMGICLLGDEAEPSRHPHPLLGVTVGALLGRLPDQLEPAVHPNHRQFFHSFLVLGICAYGVKRAYEWQPESQAGELMRWLLLIGGASYLSHLALDAITRKSLPLVGSI